MSGQEKHPSDSHMPSTAHPSAPPPAQGDSTGPMPRAPLDEQPTVVHARAPLAEPLPLGPLSREIGPALVGSTLGHFRLDEFIGGGGMGVVFRAHDLSLDRSVAVKVLSQQQTEESLKRFHNEAQSAARLDHPNIARVYYVGEDRGWNYIVFEYIEGVNIRDLVAHKGPLSVEESIDYSLQIASAIDHAWKRNVIHRDIKPSNILIQEDGQAKLVDMGLARLHHDPVTAPDHDLTASGTTLGTFDYISPEQARDPREADVRSDLYSLGCTMYFMLTGQPPFPEGTVLQKLLSHSSERPTDLRAFRDDLPSGLVAIVDRLLAKRPADRFQTPEDLIAALLAIAEDRGMALADPLWRHRARPLERSPAWWERAVPWLIAAAVIIAVAALSESVPVSHETEGWPEIRVAAERERGSRRPDLPHEPDPGASPTGEGTMEPAAGSDPPTSDEPATPATLPERPSSSVSSPVDSPAAVASEAKGGSAGGSSDTVTPSPQIIQVGPYAAEAVGQVGFATLEEALRYAAEHPSVRQIVLAWDGVQTLRAQLSEWSLLRERPMSLRAAQGHQVVLAIAPDENGGLHGLEPPMIALGPARWTFEGIHWVWNLDPTLQARQGWSLFELAGAIEATFRDCTFTISNVDEQGFAVHPNVAVFRVVPNQPVGMTGDSSEPHETNTAPQIWLERCLVRGEATLVCQQSGDSMLFSWRQGILVTPGRAAMVRPAPSLDPSPPPRVELHFEDVLLFAARGLMLAESSPLEATPPELALHLTHCVTVVEPSDPPVAVVDLRGIEAEQWRPPELTGRRNRYAGTGVALRVQGEGFEGGRRSYTFEELRMKPPSWYGEELPQPLPRNPWSPWSPAASRATKRGLVGEPEQQRTLQMLQFEPELWEWIPEAPELERP